LNKGLSQHEKKFFVNGWSCSRILAGIVRYQVAKVVLMGAPFCRKYLSIEGLLKEAHRVFRRIPDARGYDIALVDHLMSGLAIFGLKYPALLQFDQDCREETTRANLKALYGIEQAPSDTCLRERLDALDPCHIRPLYTALLSQLQRGKGLELQTAPRSIREIRSSSTPYV